MARFIRRRRTRKKRGYKTRGTKRVKKSTLGPRRKKANLARKHLTKASKAGLTVIRNSSILPKQIYTVARYKFHGNFINLGSAGGSVPAQYIFNLNSVKDPYVSKNGVSQLGDKCYGMGNVETLYQRYRVHKVVITGRIQNLSGAPANTCVLQYKSYGETSDMETASTLFGDFGDSYIFNTYNRGCKTHYINADTRKTKRFRITHTIKNVLGQTKAVYDDRQSTSASVSAVPTDTAQIMFKLFPLVPADLATASTANAWISLDFKFYTHFYNPLNLGTGAGGGLGGI